MRTRSSVGAPHRQVLVVAAVAGLLALLAMIGVAVYAMPIIEPSFSEPAPAAHPNAGTVPDDRTTEPGPTTTTHLGVNPLTSPTTGLDPTTTGPLPTPSSTVDLAQFVREGVIGFRGPGPMRVDERRRVTVRVADNVSAVRVSDLSGTGSVTVEPATVGSYLRAALTSPDFDITRVGDDDGRRSLLTDDYAEWAWDVRPLRSGQLRLDVTLYVLQDSETPPLKVRTYERAIQVEVNTWYSVTSWLKVWGPLTGLTVPVIIGGVWVFIQHTRSAKQPASGWQARVSRRNGQPSKLRRREPARKR